MNKTIQQCDIQITQIVQMDNAICKLTEQIKHKNKQYIDLTALYLQHHNQSSDKNVKSQTTPNVPMPITATQTPEPIITTTETELTRQRLNFEN